MSGHHPILFRLALLLLQIFIISIQPIISQCTTGNEPECKCKTAPVLCTIDELDGYTFSMAAYLHEADGPSPICPGAPMSQTNNPTWFAFTAWCTNLKLRVHSTNCHQVFGSIGFQLAIYTNCTFNHVVACNADIQDCNTNDKILNLTGLNIGAIYYFMVDGCLGSYCTVTIDIIGVCGQEVIAPWTEPLTGNMSPCVGDSTTYVAQNLDGARIYHWFVNGAPAAQTTSDSFNIRWTTSGTYLICIDASNDPCVPVTDPPFPLCTTITVHEADAGILNVNPTALCPHESTHISSSGFIMGPDNTQVILVTDIKGTILSIINAESGSFISDTSGVFNVYAYNFVNGGGMVPMIGGHISDLDCSSACCDLVSQSITFQNIEAVVSNIICDDNGTSNDSTDDTFTFDVLVTGSQVGSSWQTTDGTITGLYGMTQTFGPYLIGAGGLSFQLQDQDVPTCIDSIFVSPPLSCSSCLNAIDAIVSNIVCNDNGTGNDSTDDTFTFDVFVTNVQAGSSWQSTDGAFTGLYGQKQTFGPFLISAGGLSFQIVDHDVPDCIASISVSPPTACSSCRQKIDAGPGNLLNCFHPSIALTGSSSEAGIYQWTGPYLFSASSLIVTVSDSGWYYLNVDYPNHCSARDSVFVDRDFEVPFADAGADQLIDCNHSQVLLDGSGSTGNHLQFAWIDDSGTIISTHASTMVSTGGIYNLQLTNLNSGCNSLDSAEVMVNQNELAQVSLLVFPESCIGDNNGMIEVTGITGGIPPYSFRLNGLMENSSGSFDNLHPGAYNMQITDTYGCTIDTSFIINPGIDLQVTLPKIIKIIEDQSVLIHAIINVPPGNLSSIEWTPKGILSCDTCLSTTINSPINQILQLTVADKNGCSATAEINILVFPTPHIYIPNTFSPNGDGINDFFTIYTNSGVESILELSVFDRWGEYIYHAHDFSPNLPDLGWDGKFHHKEMPSGTFVYSFKVLMADGIEKTFTGDVTLIK